MIFIIFSIHTQTHIHTPVGDFESCWWCEFVVGGGSGCNAHATELFIVLLISCSSAPVTRPTAVPGSQAPVALLQVYGVQISVQLKWYGASPALPRDSLSGFHLWIRWDRGIWIRWKRGMCFQCCTLESVMMWTSRNRETLITLIINHAIGFIFHN